MDKRFQRKILEAYLIVIILLLTFVSYIALAGVGFEDQSEFFVLAILIIVLIGVNTLQAILQIHTINYLDTDEQDDD